MKRGGGGGREGGCVAPPPPTFGHIGGFRRGTAARGGSGGGSAVALAAPRSSGCGGAPAVGQRWGRRRRETERDGLVGAPPRRCARMTTAMKAALPQAWGQGSPRSPTSPPLPPIHLPNTPPPPPHSSPSNPPPSSPHIFQLCPTSSSSAWGCVLPGAKEKVTSVGPAVGQGSEVGREPRAGAGGGSQVGQDPQAWFAVNAVRAAAGERLGCNLPHILQLWGGGCPRSSHSAPHPPTALGAAPYPPALGRGGLPHILPFCLTSSNSSAPHRTALGWGGGCPTSANSASHPPAALGAAPHPPALGWGGLPHILSFCPTSYSSGAGAAAPHLPILPLILQQLWRAAPHPPALPHILQLWGRWGAAP